jgi:hypothetical protein
MNTHRNRCWQAATVGALLVSALSAAPASAVMLHGPSLPPRSTAGSSPNNHTCLLQRVGTQFVRCDNLAGNGVEAPLWVPEH